MRVTFLGTSAACPTVRRNVSAIAVQREGDLMLFDCGEGTQRQMMRYGTGFSLWAVFITHMHADHFVGVTGMLRTMALQGRNDPLLLTCPVSGRRVLEDAVHLGFDRLSFPVEVRELRPGDCVSRDGYEVRAFRVNHGMPALGYVLREEDRRGRFDVERARALGVPEGPAFGRLHRGETVEVEGRAVRPEEVVGPGRPGRTVVYTGDTRPVRSTVEAAAGADLLVHECTFAGEDKARARATFHSTATGAAHVARDAGVARLALTHISARYSEQPARLEREARRVFPATVVAGDGMTLEVPYRDDPAATPPAGGREGAA